MDEICQTDNDAIGDFSTRQQAAADWTLLDGRNVEIYDQGKVVDGGRVDGITRDGSILWLAQDGACPRRLIERLPERTVAILTAQ